MIDSKKLLEAAHPIFELILKESGLYLDQYLPISFDFNLIKNKDGSYSVANAVLSPRKWVYKEND